MSHTISKRPLDQKDAPVRNITVKDKWPSYPNSFSETDLAFLSNRKSINGTPGGIQEERTLQETRLYK
jgi:hypothetical protein